MLLCRQWPQISLLPWVGILPWIGPLAQIGPCPRLTSCSGLVSCTRLVHCPRRDHYGCKQKHSRDEHNSVAKMTTVSHILSANCRVRIEKWFLLRNLSFFCQGRKVLKYHTEWNDAQNSCTNQFPKIIFHMRHSIIVQYLSFVFLTGEFHMGSAGKTKVCHPVSARPANTNIFGNE